MSDEFLPIPEDGFVQVGSKRTRVSDLFKEGVIVHGYKPVTGPVPPSAIFDITFREQRRQQVRAL